MTRPESGAEECPLERWDVGAAAGAGCGPVASRLPSYTPRLPSYTPRVTRDELIEQTRRLVAEGDRLAGRPSMDGLRTWLQASDALLAAAWGSMDRYHLAWLMVGKPADAVRGRPMTPDEEAAYVREVAAAKTASLLTSLDAVERQGMPFVGETGGMAPGQGTGAVPLGGGPAGSGAPRSGGAADGPGPVGRSVGALPGTEQLADRVREAREAAERHAAEQHSPRAPRPEKMQR